MAAKMKVNTRRLGEDIAALSDRLAAMQRTAAELAPALDAPRADALTEQLDRLDALLDRLARSEAHQSAEFISIFYGEDVTEEQAQKAEAIFTAACPNAEVSLLSGGQPVYYYMISAE